MNQRGRPDGWYPEAPFHFVDSIEAAMNTAQELAGDRVVEIAAGDVGGQVLAAGLIDEVLQDIIGRPEWYSNTFAVNGDTSGNSA